MANGTYWQTRIEEERAENLNEAYELRGKVGDGKEDQLTPEETHALTNRSISTRHYGV